MFFGILLLLDVLSKSNYNTDMNFEWDDAKRKINIKKHGIDFIGAPVVFDNYTLTVEDDRFDYGEERFISFGVLKGRVVVIVHTENDNSIRIISIRRATKYEEKAYFSQIPD